jgi:hypothetical protein
VTTPDLRDKFVVGAGSSYVKGATGGATTASHKHVVSITSGVPSAYTVADYAGGVNQMPATDTHTHLVSGDTALSAPSILPPYHGLYYIMKVA